ncbi:hypothetical protein [Kordiimonas pumila]|uniref:Uncharacterized protein n=1 Tax=Kordiimonas pumila TaxID=2161677 RepID=A0ABV7D5Z1_9PROT|nr:hypothetical protein [Kordiimonas pumila]
MKPIYLVFVLLLMLAAITVFVLLSGEPQHATGISSEFARGMKMGGDGAARLETIGRAPFYFQLVVTGLAGVLLYMGIAPARRDKPLIGFIVLVTFVNLAVWAFLYTGYEAYLQTGETSIAFGFPAPTNWTFWGIWLGYMLFNIFYVIGFRRYFFTHDDEAAFKKLVQECKSSERGI